MKGSLFICILSIIILTLIALGYCDRIIDNNSNNYYNSSEEENVDENGFDVGRSHNGTLTFEYLNLFLCFRNDNRTK